MKQNLHRKKWTGKVTGEKNVAMRVSSISIVINLVLSVVKLFAGILAKSGAMISDAVHSASDVFSTIIVIIGVKIAEKESDQEHPYGHERLECVAAILLAIVLAVTGLGIGNTGLQKISGGNYKELEIPGILALIAAIVSIVVKEWMYWYTRINAKKIHSPVLMADAWHHRSDALSSIGALAGIAGARMGFPVLDSAASLLICVFIIKAACDILKDSLEKMIDKSCSEEMMQCMRRIILEQEGVQRIDVLKTRLFGAKVYVDVEISVDAESSLLEAHEIAQQVHDAIEGQIPRVKHCMVHENPMIEEKGKEVTENESERDFCIRR